MWITDTRDIQVSFFIIDCNFHEIFYKLIFYCNRKFLRVKFLSMTKILITKLTSKNDAIFSACVKSLTNILNVKIWFIHWIYKQLNIRNFTYINSKFFSLSLLFLKYFRFLNKYLVIFLINFSPHHNIYFTISHMIRDKKFDLFYSHVDYTFFFLQSHDNLDNY